jgi:hypothetical protein
VWKSNPNSRIDLHLYNWGRNAPKLLNSVNWAPLSKNPIQISEWMYQNLQIQDRCRKGAELMKTLIPMKFLEHNPNFEVLTKFDRKRIWLKVWCIWLTKTNSWCSGKTGLKAKIVLAKSEFVCFFYIHMICCNLES